MTFLDKGRYSSGALSLSELPVRGVYDLCEVLWGVDCWLLYFSNPLNNHNLSVNLQILKFRGHKGLYRTLGILPFLKIIEAFALFMFLYQ